MPNPNALKASRIIAGAIVAVADRRRELAKALAIPFAAYVLIDFLPFYGESWIWTVAVFCLTVGVQTIFAITTHRLILLGAGSVPEWGIRAWTRRETLFAVHLFTIGLMFLVPAPFLPVLPPFVVVLGFLLALWIMSRVSLVFPGIAIDQGVTFSLAWDLSKGHQISLALIVFVLPILASIPMAVTAFLPMAALWWSILSTLLTVLTIAALSLAYFEIQRLKYASE